MPSTYTLILGGVALGIAILIGAAAFFIARKKAAAAEEKGSEEVGPSADAAVPPSAAEVNVEKLFKLLAKHTAQQVGPKISKANKVKNVLETRIFGFKNKAATFVMDEVYGVIARILRELEAEEAMLLLDPAAAAQANLPPASILLAGVLSPLVLLTSFIIHLSQVLLVLVPVLLMCAWALDTDWNTLDTCAVPTLNYWIYIQGALALLLLVSHIVASVQIWLGYKSIKQKMADMQDRLREALSDGELSLTEIRELFICYAILLEHCLLVEDNLRRSVWRTIIGYGTIAWMAMTAWTFVIVLGWTFVPGMVAFHPSAASVAGKDYCGAWATVFTARLSCVLSLLFLMCNVISVLQWVSDLFATSEKYTAAMIDWSKKFDANAGGFPVMQTLVKAFLLRGNGDSIQVQLAQSYNRKEALQKERDALQARIDSLKVRIDAHKAEALELKKQQGLSQEDEDAAMKVVENAGEALSQQAQELVAQQAKELQETTKKELEATAAKFWEAVHSVQQSSMVQDALQQAQQVHQQVAEGGIQGVTDAASSGLATAQEAAGRAAASAQDVAGCAAASAQEVAGRAGYK